VILNRADAEQQATGIQRNIDSKRGAAGGANDGRGDGNTTTTDNGHGGTATTMREKAGGEAEQQGGGRLNWDAVLAINQKINPGSGS
jgi:hypothetical protein